MATLTQPRTILVAEDNLDALATLELLFQLEGHTVFCAEDGEAAIKLAEKHVPDAILLDLSLPKIEGLEVGKLVRAKTELDKSILIAHTGRIEHTGLADEIGFDYYALKPVDPSMLLEVAFAPRQDQLILLSQSLIERSVQNIKSGNDLSERSRIAREKSRAISDQNYKLGHQLRFRRDQP